MDELEAQGKTWQVFAQNVPLNCYTDDTASGGEDGSGTYARKHEPAISFTDISGNPTRCANITHFDPAAANFEFIVPNVCNDIQDCSIATGPCAGSRADGRRLCNDIQDCSIATGDTFLKGFIPKTLNSAAWQQGGVLVLTWGEGTTSTNGGGQVATVVISNSVAPGLTSNIAHNHYSLLHTIENAWGLPCLNNTCAANDPAEFFH